jgi:dTDP-glucose 4,6-dehydratase
LARELLHWEPKISRQEGLERTYAYFKTLSEEALFAKEHNNFEKYIVK